MLKTLLNAVTAIGEGSAFKPGDEGITRKPFGAVGFDTVITGAPTQVTLVIKGSFDGVNFSVIHTQDVTANGPMFFLADKPILQLKAELTVLTGGTAPTVTLKMLEGE